MGLNSDLLPDLEEDLGAEPHNPRETESFSYLGQSITQPN